MKVLQLSKYYPPVPGGIESYVGDLSHALVSEGHENLVLAHRFEPSEPEDITGPMGRVIRVPSYGEVMYAPMAPAYPIQLRRQLREFNPDMLLVHMPNVSGFWPLFTSLSCPLVVFWHADVVFPKEKWMHNLAYKGYSFFEKQLLKKATSIITTSEPYLEYSKPLEAFRNKCKVIPLGLDASRIPDISEGDVANIKRKSFGTEKVQYVYAAGRFAHYKGFSNLVEAAALARQSHPHLKFVIAGDGETRPTILKQIQELGLNNVVSCPGRISDTDYWALMKGCELFCLPSIERSEAFGVVLLEAMAMGKPCISTDIPGSGTGWVNKHESTGLVVPADDVTALHGAIAAIVDSPDSISLYGENGIQRVDDKFQITQAPKLISDTLLSTQ